MYKVSQMCVLYSVAYSVLYNVIYSVAYVNVSCFKYPLTLMDCHSLIYYHL